MENDAMLTKKQLQIFAAELLTPEYSDRLKIRLDFLYDKYFKTDGIEFIDTIVETLQSYQDYVYEIIRYHPYPTFTNPYEESRFYKNPPDKSKRTQEEINIAKNDKEGSRVILYGKLITGIRGPDLSWNDIELVKQEVINFKESKKQTSDATFKHNLISENEDKNQKNNNVNLENDTHLFSELFPSLDKMNKCIEVLKNVTSSEGRALINESGQIVIRRGHKSIIFAWLDSLLQEGLIKTSINRIIIIKLINEHFPDLDLKEDLSLWDKMTDIGVKFKPMFTTQIKKIK